ncbi:hypothetical protein N0V94_007538, partial [Neodidymelliopsis sp. IMI 364377]
MAPRKKTEKEEKATGAEGSDMILTYLPAAAKFLKDLHEQKQIEGRPAGKQIVYHALQNPKDAISSDQLAALDDQIADLKTRTTDLQTLAKTLRSTLTSLNSTLSTADLLSSISSLELEKSEILTRLESLKAGHARKITAEEREKVEQEWKAMRSVAMRREAIAKMFWGMVEDGKSSITLRLVRSEWTSDYDPTIEDSYSVTRAVDGHSYYLMLTDTAGQEEYRGLWAASNLQSDAFLLVYDITSAPSLPALDYFMEMIAMESEHRIDSHRPPPVKIVAGNKCDLPAQRQIDAKTGLEWARKHGCGFMETSAREMVNIEETFAL